MTMVAMAAADDRPMISFDELKAKVDAAQANVRKGRRWYLVHSHAQRIGQAIAHLRAVGYQLYYPSLRRMRPVPRKQLSHKQRREIGSFKRPALEPLFPQYPFLQLDLRGDPWRTAFAAAGFSGIACLGDEPSPLPEGFVEGIKAREHDGALPHNVLVSELLFQLGRQERITTLPAPIKPGDAAWQPPYEAGELVRINDGPLSGFTGTIERMPSQAEIGDLDSAARVKVLAQLFGRATPVELELGQIEKS